MDKLLEAIQYNLKQSVAQTDSPIEDINRVYFGDPRKVKDSEFPIIAVMPIGTEYVNYGTEYDQKTVRAEIRVVFNQKDYFNNYIGSAKTITNAVYSAGYVTFSVTGHGYSADDSVTITGMTPTNFNTTSTIYDAPTADTFRVAFSSDPGTFSAGGTVKKGVLDKIYMVEKAVKMVEQNTGLSTDQYTICGTIQNNKDMGYINSSGTTVSATCNNITPESVSYEFTDNRGFPAYEVIVSIRATLYGDR